MEICHAPPFTKKCPSSLDARSTATALLLLSIPGAALARRRLGPLRELEEAPGIPTLE